MTSNILGKCKYCSTIFRLRFQVGYFNIPVYFRCPNCYVDIEGIINIDQESPNIIPDIRNFEMNNSKMGEEEYIIEQSVEFPQRKLYKVNQSNSNDMITPFIRTCSNIGFTEMQREYLKINLFLEFKDNLFKNINDLNRLFNNNKLDIVKTKLKEIYSDKKIISKLDVIIAIRHMHIKGIKYLLKEETLNSYIKLKEEIFNLFYKNNNGMIEFIKHLDEVNVFDKATNKLMTLISDFYNIYEKLLPIIIAVNTNTFENINKSEYGISTIGYSELEKFYTQSYETILDYVDILIGLNNISVRNSYSLIPDSVTIFNDFYSMENTDKKIKKLDALLENEPFSYGIILNNRIRNSIAHYNVKIDYNNQLITFIDKYNGIEKKENIYYIEFAKMCLDNLYSCQYLYEVIYQLSQLKYISEGEKPNFLYDKNNNE